MYNGLKILALIPARGGSKGIKNKNIIDLCGKPLIQYTIDAAKGSKYIDDVVVSTDSEAIADVARKCGAEIPFLRPVELATDTSKSIDVVVHAVDFLKKQGREYDCVLFLQPTQPLRTVEDIDLAVDTFYSNGRKSLVSVCEVENHPILMRTINKGILEHLMNCGSDCRRQDMSDYYCVNGCIYINPIEDINRNLSQNDNIITFIMPVDHSVDIDEEIDLKKAEFYLSLQKKKY